MGNSIQDVNVVENYGNVFVFEADDCISGIYTVVPENTEGRVRTAEATFYYDNGRFRLSIDNNDEIDKGYIQYTLNNKISCQYSYDISGNIDLYFNYDNYINPKFKSLDLYRNSFLHLNKDNTEGLLAIAAEYKEKYEMPGAYYLISYLSDTKPKFNLRKLTYAEKTKWLYDRSHDYSTDDLIDYIEDDQYLRLDGDDDDIEVSSKDFIDNDNLHLAGGNVVDFSIPIDPDDEISKEQIDEYIYCYITCEIEQNSPITGDVGITNAMRVPITAKLKWGSQYVGNEITKTITGYTTNIASGSSLSFNPIYLDFGDVILPDFEYAGGKKIDLQANDMTVMHKVIPAKYALNSNKKYDITATANFSDNTQYVTFEDETTKMLGGRFKKYGVYIIVNATGKLTGEVDTLQERVNQQIYHTETGKEHAFGPESEPLPEPEPKPEPEDPEDPKDPEDPVSPTEEDPVVPTTGYVVTLDYNITDQSSTYTRMNRLYRVHDVTGMSLSTKGVKHENSSVESSSHANSISTYKGYIKEINAKEQQLMDKYNLNIYTTVMGTTVNIGKLEDNSKALDEFVKYLKNDWGDYLENALKAYKEAYKRTPGKSEYGDILISAFSNTISSLSQDASNKSYRDVAGTYGVVFLTEADDKDCPYCGLTTESSMVNSGIGYDVIDIKSGIFACGSTKPYMFMPKSRNNFCTKDINFENSSVDTSGDFTTMDVFTSVSSSGNAKHLKANLDFVDIPSGHRTSIAFNKDNSNIKLHTEKGLYCYDIKLKNGNFDASSSWYYNQVTKDVSGKGHKEIEGFWYNGIRNTVFEQVYFKSKQVCDLDIGGSGEYGSYQTYQMFKTNYDYYNGSSYYSKYDCGLTYMYCGYNDKKGHQVYVIQPQFAPMLDENGDIGIGDKYENQKQADGSCKQVYVGKKDLLQKKQPFNSAQCVEMSSQASNVKDFFKQNRIRCLFITKGYYAWNKTTFNGNTDYKYKRPSSSGWKEYQLYVLNVVYDSKPSNVVIQIPINALNCGGTEERAKTSGYETHSWMANMELPDFADIVNYEPGSESIPAVKESKTYDFAAQSAYNASQISNGKVSSSASAADAWYTTKISVPPVQNLTYVCTNGETDIVKQGSNAHPLLLGTENGLYRLDFDGTIKKVIDSGTVKRIVRVRIGSSYAYLCLFTNGTLMGSRDNGSTWDVCQNKFPKETIVDISTDICSGTTNNTAILTSKKLYFGHIIQTKTEVQNIAQEVGVKT